MIPAVRLDLVFAFVQVVHEWKMSYYLHFSSGLGLKFDFYSAWFNRQPVLRKNKVWPKIILDLCNMHLYSTCFEISFGLKRGGV